LGDDKVFEFILCYYSRMMTQKYDLKKASTYLQKKDPVLGKIIEKVPPLQREAEGSNYFLDLVESIVGQQLSVKAADTIWGRLINLSDNGDLTAKAILQIPDEKIRAAGISWSKIKYIKDLATKTIESPDMFEHFDTMSDEEIIDVLTKVKGIGRWTAEMFLMFAMGRPDIFSYGDLGLKNAIKKLYSLKEMPTEKQANKIAEKWKPYRTVACRYLWKSLELK